jgi:hypothetical protein
MEGLRVVITTIVANGLVSILFGRSQTLSSTIGQSTKRRKVAPSLQTRRTTMQLRMDLILSDSDVSEKGYMKIHLCFKTFAESQRQNEKVC